MPLSKNIDDARKVTVIRPAAATLAIFGVMWAIPIFIAVRLMETAQLIAGIVIVFLATVLFLGPIVGQRISWNNEFLSYRQLLITRRIKTADIRKVEFHAVTLKSRLRQTSGLCIYTSNLQEPAMIINTKPFSRGDIAALKETLQEHRT